MSDEDMATVETAPVKGTVLTWHRNSGVLEAFSKELQLRCLVRNEVNPAPYVRHENEVVYSELAGKKGVNIQGPPYMPREFPIGIWNIVGLLNKEDEYEAPIFISTDAKQELPVWEVLQKDKLYYVRATDQTIIDTGYGLHNSTSSTTLGCGRIIERDINHHENLMFLVYSIGKILEARETIQLEVVGD